MKISSHTSRAIFFILLVICTSCSSPEVVNPTLTTPDQIEYESQQIEDDLKETQEDENNQINEEISPKLEIEIWHPFSGATAEFFDSLISEFNSENQQSLVVSSVGHADKDVLIEDLSNVFESETDAPDLVISNSLSIRDWFQAGYPIQELDAIIIGERENSETGYLFDIYPVFWDIDIVDGKRIGIPAYQSGQFLFYNKTWAKELGFEDYPNTTDNFKEQICVAYKNNLYDDSSDNNGTGGWIYSQEPLDVLTWMKAFGGGALINSKMQPVLTETGNINALTFLFDLYLEDCAWTGKEANPHSYFSKRYTLIYSGTMEDIIVQSKIAKISDDSDEWMVIPYPSEDGKPQIPVEGYSFAITTQDEAGQLAAWELIKWMLEPTVQSRFVENTGVFPLSYEIMNQINPDLSFYSIWKDSLQYLPFAEPEPAFSQWYIIGKLFQDISWQLIQFTMTRENIPNILADAESIVIEYYQ